MKLFIYILMIISITTFASDKAKEKRWESQIIDTLMDGKIIYLGDDSAKFLAIDMPSVTNNKKGAIIIHGIGVHPNWPQIIQPIRIGLAEAKLHTLSIQMPILQNSATTDDYLPLMSAAATRIKMAIIYLRNHGINNITLIAHSLGTQMTTFYLSKNKIDNSITSFIGISMLATTIPYLININLPILDIFGSDDNQNSLNSTTKRLQASADNKLYKQIKIIGANHFFDDKEEKLLNEIKKYLKLK